MASSEDKQSFRIGDLNAILEEHEDPFSPVVLRRLTGDKYADMALARLTKRAAEMKAHLARQGKELPWPWSVWERHASETPND